MVKGVPITKRTYRRAEAFAANDSEESVGPVGPIGPIGKSSPVVQVSRPSPDSRDYELMRLRLWQNELERKIKKYENTIDIFQYSLILMVVLLLIKTIVDSSKK